MRNKKNKVKRYTLYIKSHDVNLPDYENEFIGGSLIEAVEYFAKELKLNPESKDYNEHIKYLIQNIHID